MDEKPNTEQPIDYSSDEFRYDLSNSILDWVVDRFDGLHRIKYPLISKRPKLDSNQYVTRMHSRLLNGRKQHVADLRIEVRVDRTGSRNGAWLTIEWAKRAAGFWYTETIYLRDIFQGWNSNSAGRLGHLLADIRHSADGTVAMRQMNMAFRKVKKDRRKDREFRRGLLLRF